MSCSRALSMLFCPIRGLGRAIWVWAWQMQKMGRDPFALPLLHRFYYQTLESC
jgi:hypothetical protein